MIKIHIYSESALQDWDGAMIEVSRVPCIGEWVRPVGYPAAKVVSVLHGVDDLAGTVAGLTLEAQKKNKSVIKRKLQRNKHQKIAYAVRRLCVAVERALATTSEEEKTRALAWAKAWGFRGRFTV